MLDKIEKFLENIFCLIFMIIFGPFMLFFFGMDNYPMITLIVSTILAILIGKEFI